ncbi:LysM peptidoglycan-binding domain-containing protein [Pseudomonas sp. MM211]|uniref:lytic transglycosylase n=1 Tax=Pseudomonas sp. MM211 TaxID=2866808 RepID=UPI001CEDE929|nr:LysM peptidoglycan-binding domain-containing protein [Pseudomonas sp. MM211]UCJ15348.1 LysM peptidoglycan-binding domain-containing protein [Pseudomonas sp. MM211]
MPYQPCNSLNSKALSLRYPALAVAIFAILSGCQSLDQQAVDSVPAVDLSGRTPHEPLWINGPAQAEQPKDIWERVRAGYQLQDNIGVNPRIEQQRLWFASNPSFVEKSGERSNPYIHYIVERLQERNMPMELALLPMIESAYNPFAYSPADAVGLWQFIPSTGRNFNLRQTSWYDGRRDVTASTQAAMNYLARLHEMFNGDWLLALAAYNAGEGRVSRAIERNQKLGLPTDYWNLSLPQETQNYVPKLLALSQVIMAPNAYGVSLSPIANEPYFEEVELKQRMDLSRVAALAEVDEDELYLLNPAFKKRITVDGPQHLLVPTQKVELLTANLSTLKPEDLQNWQEYVVRPGDNLHGIANRYELSVASIKELNQIAGNTLRVGQLLNLPTTAQPAPDSTPQRTANTAIASRSYQVRNGDNLWQIAKAHNVAVTDIQRWNTLKGNSLRVGQNLKLQGTAGTQAVASLERDDVTYYKVRKGDSLHLIAKRFNVQMKNLQSWNPRTGKALKPGQVLTLRLPN